MASDAVWGNLDPPVWEPLEDFRHESAVGILEIYTGSARGRMRKGDKKAGHSEGWKVIVEQGLWAARIICQWQTFKGCREILVEPITPSRNKWEYHIYRPYEFFWGLNEVLLVNCGTQCGSKMCPGAAMALNGGVGAIWLQVVVSQSPDSVDVRGDHVKRVW